MASASASAALGAGRSPRARRSRRAGRSTGRPGDARGARRPTTAAGRSRRWRRRRRQLDHVLDLAGERVRDEHLVRAVDAQVAAEVGRARAVRGEQRGGEVGRVALGAAAEVELRPGRARDRAGRVVDVDAPPRRRRVGCRRARGGRGAQRLVEVRARMADERAGVAGLHDGAEQRRVGQPAGGLGARQRGADGVAQLRGCGHRLRAGRRSAGSARCRDRSASGAPRGPRSACAPRAAARPAEASRRTVVPIAGKLSSVRVITRTGW